MVTRSFKYTTNSTFKTISNAVMHTWGMLLEKPLYNEPAIITLQVWFKKVFSIVYLKTQLN